MNVTLTGTHACVACGTPSTTPFDQWSEQLCLFTVTRDNRFFADLIDGLHDEIECHAEKVCKKLGLSPDLKHVLHNDAAMKLLSAAFAFDCRKRLVPYFKSIVTRCGLDRLRQELRLRMTAYAFEPMARAIDNPAVRAASNEAVQRITAAVARLPGMEGQIMAAKIAGSRRREIAQMFGFTLQRVSQILTRARCRLRTELG